jgi:hypothetical protein
VSSEFLSGRGIMEAPRILLKAVTIALVAGVWPATPAQPGAADIPRGSLTKAVDALEDSTGGKMLEIRFVNEVGHDHFESVVAKPDEVIYVAVNPVNEDKKRKRVAIDDTSGARIANPEELYEPWTPVRLLRN